LKILCDSSNPNRAFCVTVDDYFTNEGVSEATLKFLVATSPIATTVVTNLHFLNYSGVCSLSQKTILQFTFLRLN
jgi:hypothetical protein